MAKKTTGTRLNKKEVRNRLLVCSNTATVPLIM